jgi:hypothetical protein
MVNLSFFIDKEKVRERTFGNILDAVLFCNSLELKENESVVLSTEFSGKPDKDLEDL